VTDSLLNLVDVSKVYTTRGIAGRSQISAVDRVSLEVGVQETVGIVGESGCGKTTLARIAIGMATPTEGRVELLGEDLHQADRRRKRQLRRNVQMVFQNPYSSIDPRFTILKCVAEPLRTHTNLRGQALETKVRQLLDEVGIPGEFLTRYSHELSGGQLQRVAIARVLALGPSLVVLDEPTSALDVSVQAQILNLLDKLKVSQELAYLFISHDLSVVRHVCDRVVVMYLGRVVEMSTTAAIFANEVRHPYTNLLLGSMTSLAAIASRDRESEQTVPDRAHIGSGCSFAPRCPIAVERCRVEIPELDSSGTGHPVACHIVNDGRW